MDKKTPAERDVEENNYSLGDAVQQALKPKLMANLLIDKRGKV